MASLLSYALTSVADVKESLGITGTSQDNLIIRKINQATEMIEAYCGLPYGYHFKEATYTDVEFEGSGTNQLSFPIRPVSSVSSLEVRGSNTNVSNWDSVDTEHYFLNSSAGLIDSLFTFYPAYNRYRATFVAGYATIPADLAEACVILASFLVDNASSGSAVKAKREGGRSIEYYDSQSSQSLIETLSLDDMLARYINYDLA